GLRFLGSEPRDKREKRGKVCVSTASDVAPNAAATACAASGIWPTTAAVASSANAAGADCRLASSCRGYWRAQRPTRTERTRYHHRDSCDEPTARLSPRTSAAALGHSARRALAPVPQAGPAAASLSLRSGRGSARRP